MISCQILLFTGVIEKSWRRLQSLGFIAFAESFVVHKGLFFPEDRGKTK
jgi:hypothetical protein